LRLLFQGRIAEGHGIEEILEAMPFTVRGRPVRLVLAGGMGEAFRARLQATISRRNLQGSVELLGNRPYVELPSITASCHVGLAIYQGTSLMNRTVGTASNKIYEYAAVGLPVIYFDNAHFREHLGRFRWACAWDVRPASLLPTLERIVDTHAELSMAARADFEGELNYERGFAPLREYLAQCLERRGASAVQRS
jgi:glycosyltransferase involved in cell wall biosynthesis